MLVLVLVLRGGGDGKGLWGWVGLGEPTCMAAAGKKLCSIWAGPVDVALWDPGTPALRSRNKKEIRYMQMKLPGVFARFAVCV